MEGKKDGNKGEEKDVNKEGRKAFFKWVAFSDTT